MANHDALIQSYLAAYRAANPQNKEPTVEINAGWVYITQEGYRSNHRLGTLAEMRDRLLRRVPQGEPADVHD